MKIKKIKVESVYYWPRWFKETLPLSEQIKIKPALITKLNRGQIYLWQALNIYDDFLDGDGRPSELPEANTYFRKFLEINYRLNLPADFYSLFNKILSDLDRANQEETDSLKLKIKNGQIIIPQKLPNFTDLKALAKKSLALGLGPVAILAYLGYHVKSQKICGLLNFFRFALAAKQLADDAHDWREDLENVKITAVNVLILKMAQKNKIILDLKKRPEIAYLLFAKISPLIIDRLNNLCRQARHEAKKLAWPEKNKLIEKIIAPLEKAAQKAAAFQKLLS
ncbi:MAG: class 1 isoprenoid biosynthesis enzyme [Patescibacteria group bacterium]|jgi:hypothetical protein